MAVLENGVSGMTFDGKHMADSLSDVFYLKPEHPDIMRSTLPALSHYKQRDITATEAFRRNMSASQIKNESENTLYAPRSASPLTSLEYAHMVRPDHVATIDFEAAERQAEADAYLDRIWVENRKKEAAEQRLRQHITSKVEAWKIDLSRFEEEVERRLEQRRLLASDSIEEKHEIELLDFSQPKTAESYSVDEHGERLPWESEVKKKTVSRSKTTSIYAKPGMTSSRQTVNKTNSDNFNAPVLVNNFDKIVNGLQTYKSQEVDASLSVFRSQQKSVDSMRSTNSTPNFPNHDINFDYGREILNIEHLRARLISHFVDISPGMLAAALVPPSMLTKDALDTVPLREPFSTLEDNPVSMHKKLKGRKKNLKSKKKK